MDGPSRGEPARQKKPGFRQEPGFRQQLGFSEEQVLPGLWVGEIPWGTGWQGCSGSGSLWSTASHFPELQSSAEPIPRNSGQRGYF